MGECRAQARLCGRDARAPRAQAYTPARMTGRGSAAFVRIRILRIGGIYRISLSFQCAFRHNRKSRQDEYGRVPSKS